MQRRAAALYFAFFVALGVGALAYMNVAQATQQPEFSVEGTTIETNGSATIAGTQYDLTGPTTAGGGGGHGGGGGGVEATLAWTNESAQSSETLENGSTLSIENTSYQILIANQSDVSSFTLREQQNVSAILRADQAVENSLATQNDTQHVVYRENQSLVPLSEYLPAPETREVQTGDTLTYEGTQTTVAEVTPSGVTLTWNAPADREVELSEGGNVTLGDGAQYFAHFGSHNERVTLAASEEYGEYQATVDRRNNFHQRMNGLWGIVFVSFPAALILLSAAYLPTRG